VICARWESFLPGTGLGGAFVHWNGQTFRFQIADFIYKTHIEQRYGKEILDPELTIQDWGVTYAELEPHYDRFEYLCGVSGKAGNIKGQIQPGGNPLEAPRARELVLNQSFIGMPTSGKNLGPIDISAFAKIRFSVTVNGLGFLDPANVTPRRRHWLPYSMADADDWARGVRRVVEYVVVVDRSAGLSRSVDLHC
jgi:hypothetical protein